MKWTLTTIFLAGIDSEPEENGWIGYAVVMSNCVALGGFNADGMRRDARWYLSTCVLGW